MIKCAEASQTLDETDYLTYFNLAHGTWKICLFTFTSIAIREVRKALSMADCRCRVDYNIVRVERAETFRVCQSVYEI